MPSAGRITAIRGPVVDIEFPSDELPDIYNAVEVEFGADGVVERQGNRLVLEVQSQLGNDTVRAVAMSTTDGLKRGMMAMDTGQPIAVPVGPGTLGRIFNVVGEPIDQAGPVQGEVQTAPIHRPAPSFEEQATSVEVFETGIKVIDLIAPFTKGGKTGVFGGAGVGKTVIITGVDPEHRRRARRLLGLLRGGRADPRGTQLWGEMHESGVVDKTVLVFGQMNEPPGARLRVGLSG
jgi:F-type H+-transporting ATPase subunit beta